jgi:integrase/recombinase XerD
MPTRSWWFPTWNGNRQGEAGGPMLANSVSATVSNAMNRAGVPGTPHALRHWFGTKLREMGADSLTIKELMGHESMATTAIYVGIPLRQCAQAVNMLPDIIGAPI